MRRPKRPAEGRFTLIEVLASLALVGIVLPAAMAGITLAMSLGDASRHRTEAAVLAGGKLAEVMATGEWLDGDEEGDFGDEWPGYSWEVEVGDWEEAEVSEVVLVVRWTARRQEYALTVTTLGYAGSE